MSCDTQDEDRKFGASRTGLSPPAARHSMRFCSRFSPLCLSYYPDGAVTPSVWALPRSLAATYGIILIFFSSGYLDVSVPRVGLPLRYVSCDTGSPIRISADLGIFAPPRSFSQLVTSFFASGSLGIPHAPFFTSFARLLA